MNRVAIVIAAAVVFALAGANGILGQHLILPLPVLEERDAGVPWYITWVMIWLNVACAVGLGVFLLLSLFGNPNRR